MSLKNEIDYWTHMLDECQLNEKADSILTDGMIDKSSVTEWSVFTDEKLNKLLLKSDDQKKPLDEDEPISGQKWRSMSFWGQLKDWAGSGTNYDGSRKGWFEDRKFPTETIKAEELTAEKAIEMLRRGVNIAVDYSTASREQSIAASKILSKTSDASFLAEYDKMMQNLGDAASAPAAAAGAAVGGPSGAAASAAATKAAVTKYSDTVVQRFNDEVRGTEYEALEITQEDLNRTWLEQLTLLIVNHPYVTMAAVIAAVLIYKNRSWIWDRLKLGLSNLWQGKIIAKLQFDLLDGTPLSFEYDLRFNKWRLLYRDFQWTGGATPDESAVKSFPKTETCQSFIKKCEAGLQIWLREKDKLQKAVEIADDPESEEAAKLAEAVLDDLDDIRRTFIQLETRVG